MFHNAYVVWFVFFEELIHFIFRCQLQMYTVVHNSPLLSFWYLQVYSDILVSLLILVIVFFFFSLSASLEVCQLYWSFQRTNFLIYIFYLFFMFSISLIWGFSFIIFLLLLGLLCFSFSRFLRWELSLLIWYFSSFLVCAFSFIKFIVIINFSCGPQV